MGSVSSPGLDCDTSALFTATAACGLVSAGTLGFEAYDKTEIRGGDSPFRKLPKKFLLWVAFMGFAFVAMIGAQLGNAPMWITCTIFAGGVLFGNIGYAAWQARKATQKNPSVSGLHAFAEHTFAGDPIDAKPKKGVAQRRRLQAHRLMDRLYHLEAGGHCSTSTFPELQARSDH